MELLGWIGAFFFAICAFPQAYKCWKQKHAYGISDLRSKSIRPESNYLLQALP